MQKGTLREQSKMLSTNTNSALRNTLWKTAHAASTMELRQWWTMGHSVAHQQNKFSWHPEPVVLLTFGAFPLAYRNQAIPILHHKDITFKLDPAGFDFPLRRVSLVKVLLGLKSNSDLKAMRCLFAVHMVYIMIFLCKFTLAYLWELHC